MDTLQFGLTLAAKGAVVLVMTALASALFARSSAALRHLSWSVGLVALLILPALAFILPDLPVGEWQPVARAWTPVAARPVPAPTGPSVAGPNVQSRPGTEDPGTEDPGTEDSGTTEDPGTRTQGPKTPGPGTQGPETQGPETQGPGTQGPVA